MKILKYYEEYIDAGPARLETLLKNMVKMFKDSFEGQNDVLGEKEMAAITLIEIEKSNSNDAIEKNIKIEFNDQEYFYHVYFVVKLEDIKGNDPIKNGYIKIVIYDQDGNILREWKSNLEIAESTQDEINKEGRYFVKVKEVAPVQGGQSQAQSQLQLQPEPEPTESTGAMEYIETFIISKISDLKESLVGNGGEKNK